MADEEDAGDMRSESLATDNQPDDKEQPSPQTASRGRRRRPRSSAVSLGSVSEVGSIADDSTVATLEEVNSDDGKEMSSNSSCGEEHDEPVRERHSGGCVASFYAGQAGHVHDSTGVPRGRGATQITQGVHVGYVHFADRTSGGSEAMTLFFGKLEHSALRLFHHDSPEQTRLDNSEALVTLWVSGAAVDASPKRHQTLYLFRLRITRRKRTEEYELGTESEEARTLWVSALQRATGMVVGRPNSLPSAKGPRHTGWMWKEGHVNTFSKWKLRWFVVDGGRLHYFKHQSDTKPRGVVPLQKADIQGEPAIFNDKYVFHMQVVPESKNIKEVTPTKKHQHYAFGTASKEAADAWIAAIEAERDEVFFHARNKRDDSVSLAGRLS